MIRRITLGAVAAAMVSATALAAPAATAAPLDNVTISVVTFNGSGCPVGSVASAISPDREAVTVIYSEYLVERPDTPQKNCTLSLRVNIPGGLSYTIASADYYGYKLMQGGATGRLVTNYRWQGGPAVSGAVNLSGATGPLGANWSSTDNTGALTWSLCGESRLFIANSRLSIGGPANGSYITMDSTDVEFSTVFHLQWIYC